MTTTTLSLADFLLARIAEDEARWRSQPWLLPHGAECSHLDGTRGWCDCRLPSRLLSRCEADRRIVEIHQVVRDAETCPTCDGCGQAILGAVTPPACDTLRALAAVYADHPDYRDSWKP